MIKSMTGYGRFEEVTEQYKISVEIKSVNHRYLDVNIKLPKMFYALENKIRGLIKEYGERGKVDVYLNYEEYMDQSTHIHYNSQTAGEYLEAIRTAAGDYSLSADISAAALVRFPDVITTRDVRKDPEQFYPMIERAVHNAGERFVQARQAEGENLYKDIMTKLSHILSLVEEVEKRSPEIVSEYRHKILSKVEEFLGDRKVDESVLATELIVYADKICVDEETVRLRSHLDNMKQTLQMDGSIGRKLDFISQEMNREANTILSKANDKQLSAIAIDLKTEIEKIREQIQNIE